MQNLTVKAPTPREIVAAPRAEGEGGTHALLRVRVLDDLKITEQALARAAGRTDRDASREANVRQRARDVLAQRPPVE